jgi:hypothetical protein
MSHPIFANQLADVLIAALVLWRVTHLFAAEEGPFRLLTRLRGLAGSGFFGQLLDCFYCLSLWLAIPLAWLTGHDWLQRLLLWPALSGAACLLERATTRTAFPGIYEEAPKE